ncbi:hypothetical protein [Janthinobacterium sp. JC611]|uniref:hypothetical protein n=1 Tax=Janthinobacterium sp. JC611 TaxID=2816201 RepID=UPI001BFD21E9|nr:hypothetical protein [Janthinobacterium sp. JC611]
MIDKPGTAPLDKKPSSAEPPLTGQDHDDIALDEALRERFPSSDPIAINIEPLAHKPQ